MRRTYDWKDDNLARAALYRAFGEEWTLLTGDGSLIPAIVTDFLDACYAEGIGASEYARRIGAGNLQAYADCLAVAAARTK